MLTVQWCLFDLFNKGRLPPLSPCEPSCTATFSIVQLWILFCSSVRGCLCSEASAGINFFPPAFFIFWRTAGGRKLVHCSTKHNPLHPHGVIFISFPHPDAILVCRIPGEGNALSHSLYLLVLDWCWCVRAGWRMEDGKLIIGEWVSGDAWYPQLLFTLWAWRIRRAETRRHPRIQLLTT